MSILHIAYLMLPFVALISLGFVLRELKILTHEASDVLLKFLMYVTLPGVIIAHLSGKHLENLIHPPFIIATIVALLSMYAITFFLHKIFFKRDLETTALASLSTSFVSTGIVGLPIMQNILGLEKVVVPVITNTILSLILIVPLTLFLARESEARAQDPFKHILKLSLIDSLKHPLVASSLIGIALLFFGLSLPVWILDTMNKMGAATFAVALIAVGVGIDFKTLQKDIDEILFLSILRMGLFTVLGFVIALYFKLPPVLAVIFVMTLALPTAKAVPGIAREHGRFASEAFQIVTITTLLTIVIMPIVVYAASILWPGVIR